MDVFLNCTLSWYLLFYVFAINNHFSSNCSKKVSWNGGKSGDRDFSTTQDPRCKKGIPESPIHWDFGAPGVFSWQTSPDYTWITNIIGWWYLGSVSSLIGHSNPINCQVLSTAISKSIKFQAWHSGQTPFRSSGTRSGASPHCAPCNWMKTLKKNAKLCEYPIICHSSRTHWNEKIIR